MLELNEVFGRTNEAGDVELFEITDGDRATRLNADVYPVGSQLSTRYEHAEGITITRDDAERLGIEIE